MNNCVRIIPRIPNRLTFKMSNFKYASDDAQSGKHGGGSGSIREAGGSFGKREAALENEYFYKLQKNQIANLKANLSDEISFHEEQIKRHQEAIERNKKRVEELSKETK